MKSQDILYTIENVSGMLKAFVDPDQSNASIHINHRIKDETLHIVS